MKLLINENQLYGINKGNVNPYINRWNKENDSLKTYIVNYGQIMISRENGKTYKVIFDSFISDNIGVNFGICIQWDCMSNSTKGAIYVRPLDKFRPI